MNGILIIAACIAIVGLGGYCIEVGSGRIGRFTTWAELDDHQFAYAMAMICGICLFLGTLIIGALFK